MAALAVNKTRAFLLENEKGLVKLHRATLHHIIQELRLMGSVAYRMGCNIIDAAAHGRPQHRERVYIVGLLRRSRRATPRFKWP